MFSDGRGENSKKIREENLERVKDFFRDNPRATQKQCADHLGLSGLTVRRRMREIAEEAQNGAGRLTDRGF